MKPALTLAPRASAVTLPADRGRKMNAAEVADEIWNRKVSAKWVLQHMRHIGFRAGREVLFYEAEARAEEAKWVERERARRAG